jgi:2-keto-4-pentenoate hydratase/2-oxohepta-3-ene-1,7-dioic acid hydratase in catechol pathway
VTTKHIRAACLALGLAAAAAALGPATEAQMGAVTFKLGTFERSGRLFVGLVLRDTQVVDVAQANTAFEAANASARKLKAATDMKDLIERYDAEWRERLHAIAKIVSSASSAPAYAFDLKDLKVHPPVRPSLILNAGGNYEEHSQGIADQQRRQGQAAAPQYERRTAPGIWERPPNDARDNPYLFIKSTTVVTGPFDPIVIPRGRTNIDFECEFAVVIGKRAKYVPIASAADYIFGYTAEIDVSDRGGRGDRKMGGSDWLVGKNHDTFGPLGPFITPKEFMKDPMNTRHVFTLNETVMQNSNTSRMSHNIHELLHYASNILSLHPGDVIAGGSPAGTNIERAEPRWMRAGDTAKCEIDGIGAQVHPVVAESASASGPQ